jgi:predicted nucleic acid-binding protein
MQTKIFVDANIAIEILLQREKNRRCVEYLDEKGGQSSISMLTVHLVYYFCYKKYLDEKIFNFLDQFIILGLLKKDYDYAKEIVVNRDFEDALQVATAMRHQCTEFLTLDKALVKNYSKIIKTNLIQ